METQKRDQVLEILDYWNTIELLGQIDIPEKSVENKELIDKTKEGQNTR